MRSSVRLFLVPFIPFLFARCSGSTPVEPASAAVKLAFISQPTTTNAGVLITPSVEVVAQDVLGNTVGGYTGVISLALGANPTGDTLLGTTALISTAGVAVFNNLLLQRIGTGYTFIASASGLPTDTSATFDITGWATQALMPTPRSGVAAALAGGVVYAMGGATSDGTLVATVEAYDTLARTWSTVAPMPRARSHFAAGVINGKVYAVGGLTGAGLTSALDVYDPVGNAWTTKTSMPTIREDFGVAVVGGILYAVGGTSTVQPVVGLGETEAYDPGSDTWSVKASLGTPRRDLAVAASGGQVYAIGGNPGTSLGGTTVEAYDPASNSWSNKTPLPVARAALGACDVNGVLYAVGGVSVGVNTLVQAFQPGVDTAWTGRAPMLTARQYFGLACSSSTLFAVGGNQGSGVVSAATETFKP